MNRLKHASAAGLLILVVFFELLAFALLSFSGEAFDWIALLFGVIIAIMLIVQYALLRRFFRHMDRYLLIIADFLVALGLVVQYRIGAEIAAKQLMMFAIGFVMMILCLLLMRRPNFFRRISWLLMLGSIAILAVLYVIGDEQYGAKNWITIGGMSFQPSEFVKVALVFVLSHYLASYVHFRRLWPMLVFVVAVAGLLVMERDLGAAVLIAGTALIVFYVATGNKRLTGLGLIVGAGGAVASYYLFDHVRARVAVWQNPWATYSTSGYQIAQGLMAIASGGLWGVGLAMGSPKLIPAYHTDYIFAVICEEFGIIAGVAVIAFYLVFIVRGAMIALNAKDRFNMLTAFGCTVLITLQSFIIIAVVIKLIPLTGITMPFVSYGGSSLISCMMLLGILEGVAVQNGKALEEDMRREVDPHE